jgi:hypothetical protein
MLHDRLLCKYLISQVKTYGSATHKSTPARDPGGNTTLPENGWQAGWSCQMTRYVCCSTTIPAKFLNLFTITFRVHMLMQAARSIY